jgi:hypothetical protein
MKPSFDTPSDEAQQLATAKELLAEWLKRAEAFPETREFRGGYRPFLNIETRRFLDGK